MHGMEEKRVYIFSAGFSAHLVPRPGLVDLPGVVRAGPRQRRGREGLGAAVQRGRDDRRHRVDADEPGRAAKARVAGHLCWH